MMSAASVIVYEQDDVDDDDAEPSVVDVEEERTSGFEGRHQ